MGLSNERTGGTMVYASKGKFQIKKPSGEGYENYPYLHGTLIGIQFDNHAGHEGKQYRRMLLQFADGNDQFSLSIDSTNGYSRAIKASLASVESFDSPLEISLSYVAETKDAGAFVAQQGHTFKWAWTKNNKPDGMPEVKSLGQVKGKQVYDFGDQEAWIESYLLREVVPKLPAVSVAASSPRHDETSQFSSGGDDSQDNQEDGSGVPADDESTPF